MQRQVTGRNLRKIHDLKVSNIGVEIPSDERDYL